MRLRERIKAWFGWLFTKPKPVPYVADESWRHADRIEEFAFGHVVPEFTELAPLFKPIVFPEEPKMSKFEVFKDAEGGFTVRLRAKNGRKRNVSESYTRHRDAIRAARGIRDDSRGAVIVDLVNGGARVE